LQENDTQIWRQKLRWIAQNGGMALLNVHPDYMGFGDGPLGQEEFPASHYADFLQSVKDDYQERVWHVLPKQLANFVASSY
jgi:hypothetical protein